MIINYQFNKAKSLFEATINGFWIGVERETLLTLHHPWMRDARLPDMWAVSSKQPEGDSKYWTLNDESSILTNEELLGCYRETLVNRHPFRLSNSSKALLDLRSHIDSELSKAKAQYKLRALADLYEYSGAPARYYEIQSTQFDWIGVLVVLSVKWLKQAHIDKEDEEVTEDVMDAVIDNYIQYYTGEVYRFTIEGHTFNFTASGFLGDDFEVNGLNNAVMNQIGWAI